MVKRMWAEMKCTFPVPAHEKVEYFIPSVPPSFGGKLGSYTLKLEKLQVGRRLDSWKRTAYAKGATILGFV